MRKVLTILAAANYYTITLNHFLFVKYTTLIIVFYPITTFIVGEQLYFFPGVVMILCVRSGLMMSWSKRREPFG